MVLIGRWTARQCCIAIGYAFPIYKSSRALRREDKAELLQWITFWLTNALFWVVELIGDTVIGWMPFYYEAKIALLLWLVLPQYRGARVLHEQWLAPTFEKHEDVIDDTISDIKRRASEKVVQVCKDTAVLALRRGSGVVVQGQQFVAAQLVQQALGKLQQPPSNPEVQDLRMPTMLSMLSAATTLATTAPPSKPASQPKKQQTHEDDTKKTTTNESKRDDKLVNDEKTQGHAIDKAPAKEKSPKRSPSPPKTAVTATAPPPRTQEKSKELVSHFKKLLVKGFALKYYTSNEAGYKHRTLRLVNSQSRYLVFESRSGTDSSPPKAKKAVKLFIHNVRRISSGKAGAESGDYASVDDSLAFVLDNGKSTLVFEAESQKTRDLVVAGTRLLVNEHKRHDAAALATMAAAFDKLAKQRAFDKWVYALVQRQRETEYTK